MTTETKIEEAPEIDMDASMQGAAVFCNKFTVSVGPVVRITFIEQYNQQNPYFRTAIALHHQDAIALYKLLQGLMKDEELEMLISANRDGLSEAMWCFFGVAGGLLTSFLGNINDAFFAKPPIPLNALGILEICLFATSAAVGICILLVSKRRSNSAADLADQIRKRKKS